jgi:hypothetical protein
MAIKYRVIDVRSNTIDSHELIVEAESPEDAVLEALGVEVTGGRGFDRDLVARVYWRTPGETMNMARLYRKRENPFPFD